MKTLIRSLIAVAFAATAILTAHTATEITQDSAPAADARAWSCTIIGYYGTNAAAADCYRGNHGDPFYLTFPCKKGSWFWTQRTTAFGNVARVGYGGRAANSYAQCPSGYDRSGGGTIHRP